MLGQLDTRNQRSDKFRSAKFL